MTRTLLALTLVGLASAAAAQPRPSTLAMSCNQTRNLITAQGAVVLSTSPTTYSRFVSTVGACQRGQTTAPAWAPTADSPQCFVGYRCRDTDLETGQ